MERKPEEKKGILTKLKENIDDHEEQMAVLGAAVRLGVVIWSGFIITLSYVELPMVKSQLQLAISRLWLRFLREHLPLSGCLQVTVRKMENLKNQQQNHEEINLAFSSVITQHS